MKLFTSTPNYNGLTAAPMDSQRVAELLECLPVEWFDGVAPLNMSAARRRQEAEKRRTKLRFDPAFGWRFVELLAQHDTPLPWVAMEDALIEAHRFLSTGEACPEFARVLAIAGHPLFASAVRAMLLAKDSDVHQIAVWLGEDDIIVSWFASLLWNPAHRRDEPGYITAVVFPQSRLSMLDAAATPAWEQALLQLGWQGGMATVFEALGTPVGSGDAVATLDDLEATLLREANVQARLGGYSRSRTSAVLREATRLVQTKKLHEVKQPFSNLPAGGLEEIGERYSVAEEIRAYGESCAGPVPQDPRDTAVRARILAALQRKEGDKSDDE